MEFDLYRLYISVNLSDLLKQTHQHVSIFSHRILGVRSSETLITPVLDSGKSLFHVLQIVCPLHGARDQLENQHISAHVLRAELWEGPRLFLGCIALTAPGEEQMGGEIT